MAWMPIIVINYVISCRIGGKVANLEETKEEIKWELLQQCQVHLARNIFTTSKDSGIQDSGCQ